MSRQLVSILGGVFLIAGSAVAGDSFEKIKKDLAESGCVHFDFLSIIESDIFDSVDSSFGEAYLSSDGRYLITLGDDQYLYDLEFLYSYSSENNQVTVEKPPDGAGVGEEISFIAHLDEYYETLAVIPDREYRLLRKAGSVADIPDSLYLYVDRNELALDQVEYFDINEELNRLQFIKQETSAACDSNLFEPNFPDSVETIKLR